jgi:hypothetical protein
VWIGVEDVLSSYSAGSDYPAHLRTARRFVDGKVTLDSDYKVILT